MKLITNDQPRSETLGYRSCDECDAETSPLVQIGEDFPYAYPAYVCRACLIKALALTD